MKPKQAKPKSKSFVGEFLEAGDYVVSGTFRDVYGNEVAEEVEITVEEAEE